jgi:hypothetical protein
MPSGFTGLDDDGTLHAYALKVGSEGTATEGKKLSPIREVTATVDPASINANVSGDTSITVAGVARGDYVIGIEAPAALDAGISYNAWVTAANTITLRLANSTAGAVNVASADWKFLIAEAG